jgi:hypothetical protein
MISQKMDKQSAVFPRCYGINSPSADSHSSGMGGGPLFPIVFHEELGTGTEE